MIRINLLKQPAKKKIKKRKLSPRLFIIPGSIIACVLLCAGLWWTLKTAARFSSKEKAKDMVRDDYTPSTFRSPQAVEDVVEDVMDSKDKLDKSGLLRLRYEEFSFMEKINYEINFAKNVCDLLGKTVFPGVDFNTIALSSFKTLQGKGVTKSKEDVVTLFEAFRRENLQIMPKPETRITANDGGGYKFVIVCLLELGLNLEAPFLIDANTIIDNDELEILVKRVEDVAKDEGLYINSGPKRSDSFLEENYRRHRYHMTATSSYNTFVAFINSLYTRHIPCAFEKFTLTALNETSLKVEADLIFTTVK